MTNMKYPPVEHVRHINLTRADLSARIFIVGYLPVELKGKRDMNFTLHLPSVKLDISMKNYVYNSSVKWNSLIGKVLEKSSLSEQGVVIGGSVANSDFCASIPFIKKKLKNILLKSQVLGDSKEWVKENAP